MDKLRHSFDNSRQTYISASASIFDIVVRQIVLSFVAIMDTRRRNLLKLSPLAVAIAATTIGHTLFAEAAPAAAATTFNVRDYGATGDGRTVDTPAINRAIDTVARAGGGMLVFPAGYTSVSQSTCAATLIFIFREVALS
jgi:hypothetical protein